MNLMEMIEINEGKIDEKKLRRMQYRIIRVEKDNLISKKKKKDDMVKELRKIIEEEANL